jgi:hypothetical protein
MHSKACCKTWGLTVAGGIAALAFGFASGVFYSTTTSNIGWDVEGFVSEPPPYLKTLTSQGMVIDEIKDSPSGWRLWEIRRAGDRLLAYSHQSAPEIVIMGGEMLGADGSTMGTPAQQAHGLSQLTERDITTYTESLPIGEFPTRDQPTTYLVLDPSYEKIQPMVGAIMQVAKEASLRIIAYPEAKQVGGMENLLAIYEADYRTPAGQSKFVTDYRGGDLGFLVEPKELLVDVLLGERLTVRAPDIHPASQQAYQAISNNLYFKERLGLTPDGEGVALSVTENGDITAVSLKAWLEENGQFNLIDQEG